MKFLRLILAFPSVLLLWFATACSTVGDGVKPQAEPLTLATPEKDPPAEVSFSSDAGVEELVEHALHRNPDIALAKANAARVFAKVPQVATLPDPMLKLAAGSMAETAAGHVGLMTGIEQALPYPGKLRALAQAAGKEAEASVAELESVRLNIATQVRQSYWDYYLASRMTAITQENLTALELIRESVDARIAANRGSQDEQLRSAGEAGKLEKALLDSRQAQASAQARLNALLNRQAGAPLPVPSFHGSVKHRDLQGLLARAEASHPKVKAAAAELESFRYRLNRAKLDRFPDFVVGLQHAAVSNSGLAPSANGQDQFYATLGITLPLWQAPRRAKIDEALAGIEGATAKMTSARANLRYQVTDAWLRVKRAQDLITLFDDQILPEAHQAFESVLTSYAAGSQSFVDALDTWRQLLTFEVQQASNQSELGRATAELRNATGELF